MRARRFAGLVAWLVAAGLPVAACGPRTVELEPRYVAVHNTLASLGLAQAGPLLQGSLAEGREARFPLELAAQCSTLAAVGGPGVLDLDLTLVDPEGKPVAHDTTQEPQAVVRACVERAGRYALVVKATRGAGDFLAATWVGGVGMEASAARAPTSAPGEQGTCAAPLPLAAGVVHGSTTRANAENEGSCSASSAPETVYRLDLTRREHVVLEVDPHFDSVLYVRRGDCTESDAEIACNDDAPHEHASRIDEVLDPGTYFVFVDGYQSATGSYKLTTAMATAPTARELCDDARELVPSGPPLRVAAHASFNHVEATCGRGAHGPDDAYRLRVPTRSRARISLHATDFASVVHLRRSCPEAGSELACGEAAGPDATAVVSALLEPGAYGVFADAQAADAHGAYEIATEIAPAAGLGASGDRCADAVPVPVKDDEISGDTFLARDDFAPSCGGAGAADVVYRLEVPRRGRLDLELAQEEGEHVLALARTCGDRSSEIACGAKIHEVVAPGTYYLTVDGKRPEALGRFTIKMGLHDAHAQEAACRAAPLLHPGKVTHGSTQGAGSKYQASCAGSTPLGSASDRIYRLVIARSAHVHIDLAARWGGVLALRTSCVDGPTGSTEIGCSRGTGAQGPAIDQVLAPGTYYVLVDGTAPGNQGPFDLNVRRVVTP